MILTWFNQLAKFGTILLIPLDLQQARGFSSFESGLLVIPQAVLSFLSMMVGGKWFDKQGALPSPSPSSSPSPSPSRIAVSS